MNGKGLIWMSMFIGSTVGGFLPVLWGDNSLFSFSSIILTAVGGILGIWCGFKISQSF